MISKKALKNLSIIEMLSSRLVNDFFSLPGQQLLYCSVDRAWLYWQKLISRSHSMHLQETIAVVLTISVV